MTPEEIERQRLEAIRLQQQANIQSANIATPSVVTAQGTSTTSIDPVTGQTTVTETLSPEQQALYQGATAAQGAQQGAYTNLAGQVAAQGPFSFTPQWQDFEGQRQALYSNAVESFDAQNQKYFDLQRQQLEQEMANQGVPVNSEEYDRRMRALLETQSSQRQQAVRDAYESSFKATQGAQAIETDRGRAGYEIAAGNFRLPAEVSSYFTGGTKYESPDFGGRGANVAPVNAGNLYLGFEQVAQADRASQLSAEVSRERTQTERDISRDEIAARLQISKDQLAQDQTQFETQISQDTELAALERELRAELARGNNASNEKIAALQRRAQTRIARITSDTARATAGAGSLSLNDRMALLSEESRLKLRQFYAEQASEQADYAF